MWTIWTVWHLYKYFISYVGNVWLKNYIQAFIYWKQMIILFVLSANKAGRQELEWEWTFQQYY